MNKMEPIRGIDPINDPSYRYQMISMDVIKEKTKICITNLDQISRDLKLPSKDVLVTYIGKKVSAKLKVEKVGKIGKNNLCDRVTMPGNMSLVLVRESIYPFIESFVLCPTCRLPELSYRCKKSDLRIDCAACGFKGLLVVDKTGESTLKKFVFVLEELTKNNKKNKKNKKENDDNKDKNDKDKDNKDNKDKNDKNDKDKNDKERELDNSCSNQLDMMLENESKEQNKIDNFK